MIYIQSFILFQTVKLIPTPQACLSVIKTAFAMSLTFRVIGSRESVRYMAVKYKVLFVQDLQTDTIK